MASLEHSKGSDRPAILALIGIVILFIAIIALGWKGMFSGENGNSVGTIVGIVVALIATALAYAIGAEKRTFVGVGLAYFFILFNLSSIGTLNAFFLLFQAENVVREEANKASSAVVALRDVGTTRILTTEADDLKNRVDSRWRSLREELRNPVLCGQGPEALRRVEELRELLPDFKLMAQPRRTGRGAGGAGTSGASCDGIESVIESYQKTVDKLVANHPISVAAAQKIAARKEIRDEADSILTAIKDVQRGLSDNSGFFKAKSGLFMVAERYTELRQKLSANVQSVNDVKEFPASLDLANVAAIGNIGEVIPFILRRLTDVATYVYILIAFFLDFSVVLAFRRVIKPGEAQTDEFSQPGPSHF